jgi:hypothetical protein
MSFTAKLTVNGSANLLAALRTAGYAGNPAARGLKIFNPSNATALYVHQTDNGSTAPGTGTDGWPVGGAATDSGKTLDLAEDNGGGLVDLGTTWLYTGGAIDIKVIVTGA